MAGGLTPDAPFGKLSHADLTGGGSFWTLVTFSLTHSGETNPSLSSPLLGNQLSFHVDGESMARKINTHSQSRDDAGNSSGAPF